MHGATEQVTFLAIFLSFKLLVMNTKANWLRHTLRTSRQVQPSTVWPPDQDHPQLTEALKETNYRVNQQLFTSRQVALIFEYLGEP